MNKNNKDDNFEHTITSRYNLLNFNFKELYNYKDLIYLFVKRDFVVFYKQTILGPLWYIIQPLLISVVFTIIFNNFAKISTAETPPFLFYLSGNIVWGYFANCFSQTSTTFSSNVNIFGKVYFPRIVVPISITILGLLQFFIQFLIFIIFLIYFISNGFTFQLSIEIIYFPLILLQVALISIGAGLIVTAITTKYKDLAFALSFFTQVWMFITPIVYPLSIVPEKYKFFMYLNPMAIPVEQFRSIFLGTATQNIDKILLSWFITFCFFVIGYIIFNKVQRNFMDTI